MIQTAERSTMNGREKILGVEGAGPRTAEPRPGGSWSSATTRNCASSVRENFRRQIFAWPRRIVCVRSFGSCQRKLIAPAFSSPAAAQRKIDNYSRVFVQRFGRRRKLLLAAIAIPVWRPLLATLTALL